MIKTFRVLLAQINTTVGDIELNTRKARAALTLARAKKADLVVFPELTLTGYPPEDLLFRCRFVDDNRRALKGLLAHTEGIAAVVGFVDKDKAGKLYNAAALISNKKIRQIYRKVELPNYGVFDEKRYFAPGRPLPSVLLGQHKIALTICEDIWQKDSFVYRRSYPGKNGLIVNISASPFHAGKQQQREALIREVARKTRSTVIYLNLLGGQDELVFDGGSLAADTRGHIVARAKRFQEQLLVVDFPCPPRAARRTLAKAEEEVYQALVLGTRDYVEKNGFKKVLIGISGGIDSALVARIAVDALGPQNVIGVTMPSPYTSAGTYADSKRLCGALGIRLLEYRIDGLFKQYLALLKKTFAAKAPDSAEENLQARIRGNILMALSNKFGHLVLTTGNKSELATGYCTLYGDMAGGFAVIKDVPKTLVFQLARWRNTQSPKNSIPKSTITRPPTAELKKNQRDQDTLPPYALLDRFLELYVEKDVPVAQTSQHGIPAAIARKIARMVDLNEYKRRQAPPGIKITPKAFGRDRRMPITNRAGS